MSPVLHLTALNGKKLSDLKDSLGCVVMLPRDVVSVIAFSSLQRR